MEDKQAVIQEADTTEVSRDSPSHHISPDKTGKNIVVDWFKVDYAVESYRSRDAWKREWSGFPDDFYPALEAHSNGITAKQYKSILKKEKKKEQGIKGKKVRFKN